jgi:hypothetical protein
MTTTTGPRLSFHGLVFLLLVGCSQASRLPEYPAAIAGSSRTHKVGGQYAPLAIDSIERVSIRDGKLVLRGASGEVTVEAPANADLSRPTHDWALTTEAIADGHRVVTFTHSQSVEDFTIELPEADADLRYGVFSAPDGKEVMVFAWGAAGQSFWGHVTIERLPSP